MVDELPVIINNFGILSEEFNLFMKPSGEGGA
jgi:hypothetical protein